MNQELEILKDLQEEKITTRDVMDSVTQIGHAAVGGATHSLLVTGSIVAGQKAMQKLNPADRITQTATAGIGTGVAAGEVFACAAHHVLVYMIF